MYYGLGVRENGTTSLMTFYWRKKIFSMTSLFCWLPKTHVLKRINIFAKFPKDQWKKYQIERSSFEVSIPNEIIIAE